MSHLDIDRGAGGIPRSRKQSPSKQARALRRAAEHSTRRMQEAVKKRRAAWPEGADVFAVERREAEITAAFAHRRGLRNEAIDTAPVLASEGVPRRVRSLG